MLFADFFLTLLIRLLDLYYGMRNIVFLQNFFYGILNILVVFFDYNMERGMIFFAVYAPNVDMMNIYNALNMFNIYLNFLLIYIFWRNLQKYLYDFAQIFSCFD